MLGCVREQQGEAANLIGSSWIQKGGVSQGEI